LGKYGDTAFLYPIYGIAEVVQSFCRMCAVWGGTYILRRGVKSMVVDRSRNVVCGVLDTTGRVFLCDNVVLNAEDWHGDIFSNIQVLSQICISVGETSLFLNSSRAFAIIPPHTVGIDNLFAVHILQLNSSANVCPKDTNILYITTQYLSSSNPDELMDKILSYLREIFSFDDIFHVSWTKKILDSQKLTNNDAPKNLYVCGERTYSVHFQCAVDQARSLFTKMYPNEVFLVPPKLAAEDISENEEDAMLRAALDIIENNEAIAK
jgi:RAB protein geranylgeranyltransferase component A